ncbi:nuclease-related domain-containing protein [Kangiella sp.]|uniref:nuclease-related domain-containing protein n=1 Tax=Kangiella sp. TaxID=1920245 RepID=UPI003A94AA61
MDLPSVFFNNFLQILVQLWWLIPVLFILGFLQSPYIKGKAGERRVKSASSRLDPSRYTIFHDVTLSTHDGTTQIDHIIISRQGIFVIETKNYSGWIFGSEKDRFWTQVIYKNKNKFQNPLFQNYKHIKVLRDLLQLPIQYFHSVIVFADNSAFKTSLPANIIRDYQLNNYISRFDDVLLKDSQLFEVRCKIEDNKLPAGARTNRIHRNNLSNL